MIFEAFFFWNYFGEGFDVDQIVLEFFDLNGELTGTYTVFPKAGETALGQNANDIVAETLDLPAITRASRVAAVLSSTNGQIDFQNFVFRAAD